MRAEEKLNQTIKNHLRKDHKS